jgi:hypothetical protein
MVSTRASIYIYQSFLVRFLLFKRGEDSDGAGNGLGRGSERLVIHRICVYGEIDIFAVARRMTSNFTLCL